MTSTFSRITALAAIVAALAFTIPQAKAQTLAESLTEAYNASGLIAQNRALLRAADEDVAQAVASMRPVLSYTATSTYRRPSGTSSDGDVTSSLALVGRMLLYDFGRSRLNVDAQKETVLATRARLIGIEQSVLLRSVSAFADVRRQAEFVRLRENNVRVITQEVRAARDRFEVGEITRTDVSLAEARLASARSQLAAAEGALVRAREEYRAVVGRLPGALGGEGLSPRLPASEDEAVSLALRIHPDIVAQQHEIAATELALQAAEAAMRPSLSLSGSVSFDDEFDRSESLGLELSGPIYQGGALSSSVRRLAAQRDAARASLHIAQQNVALGVGNAYANLRVAAASLEAFERQIAAARIAFEGVREEAELGARTTLDVLDAEQELLDAEANRVSALSDRLVARYAVLEATGLLTAEHLGLPVQRYDPAAYYELVKSAPAAMSAQGRALDRVLDSIGNR